MKKSLLDIQQEIRNLDNKMKELSSSIADIYNEIDELRNDDADDIDYEMIRVMSLHLPFGMHPLNKLDDVYARKMYIKSLLSFVQDDYGSETAVNRLIFIQWILTQAKLDETLKELYKDALKVSTDTFGDLVEVLPKQYRRYLVVDALIAANICGQANSEVLRYIANLCDILGIEKEQLRSLAIIAKGVLQQDFGNINKEDFEKVFEQSKYFKYYLTDNILYAALCSQRTVAVEAPDIAFWNFTWKAKQLAKVEKGDLLATCRKGPYYTGDIINLRAPCAGILFQFRNNNTNYGVIAHGSDNKDSIKAWVIQKAKQEKK